MDCCVIESAANVIKQELYTGFLEYVRQHKLPTLTSQTFFRNLPMYARVEAAQLEKEGKRKHCFIGIGLKARKDWGRKEAEDEDGPSANNWTPQESGVCNVCGREATLGLDRTGKFLICEKCYGVDP